MSDSIPCSEEAKTRPSQWAAEMMNRDEDRKKAAHTDPIRLVLSLEQLRDPIIKAMGQQLSLKDRELAIANEEIFELQKRLAAKPNQAVTITASRDKPGEAPVTILARVRRPRLERTVNNHAAAKAEKPKRAEPWIIATLREQGPLTAKEIAAEHGCGVASVWVAISNHRDRIIHDDQRPHVYRLKEANA